MKRQREKFQCISLILFFICSFLCAPWTSVQAEGTTVLDRADSLVEGESFRDIAGHWAEKLIAAWTARGLVGGYPDSTFRPDISISRAEFLALVNRAFGYTETAAVTFHDIAETDWYAAEFATAAAVGYIGGYSDGTAKPQNPITRQEVAVVLERILPIAEVSEDNEDTIDANFTDQAQTPEWSKTAIATAVKGGYMSGYPDGTFQPDKPITRAEALAVLDRTLWGLYITVPVPMALSRGMRCWKVM